MEAGPQATTNAKTVTNVPHPQHTSETIRKTTEPEDLETTEQLPTPATDTKVNNVMAKSVATAGNGSPAVGGAGGKVISDAAKAAAMAAAEALKSGDFKIANPHLNSTKPMSNSTNHTNLCLKNNMHFE